MTPRPRFGAVVEQAARPLPIALEPCGVGTAAGAMGAAEVGAGAAATVGG